MTLSILIGNLVFGPVALVLALLGRRQKDKLRSRQFLIASLGVGVLGIVIAIAGWGVLGSFLVRKFYLEGRYCPILMSIIPSNQQIQYLQNIISLSNIQKISYCYASSWNTLTFAYGFSYTIPPGFNYLFGAVGTTYSVQLTVRM